MEEQNNSEKKQKKEPDIAIFITVGMCLGMGFDFFIEGFDLGYLWGCYLASQLGSFHLERITKA